MVVFRKYLKCLLLLFPFFLVITLHAQKPGEWIPLADDHSLKGWKKVGGGGLFTNENGVITGISVIDTANTFLITEKEYGDFILELDVMIESPLSNSGIQTRSHFGGSGHERKVYGRQMEIDPSARKWTGGIYDEDRREWLYPLELNPAAKSAFIVGKYNHVKIECIGNEMKTWINKVPVAYVMDTLDNKGFIGLQVHAAGSVEQPGHKVYFRNIKIKTTGLEPEAMPAGMHIANLKAETKNDY
jgi:Domain of Unknown Function (DUF1080)